MPAPESKGFGAPALQAPPAQDAPQASLTPPSDDGGSYQAFMDLLTEAGKEPAAKEFAEEFQKDPELDELFDGFQEDQESGAPKTTVASFARTLADKAEFRHLVSKFAQDPGFRAAGVALSQNPQLKPVVHELIARLEGRRSRAMVASRGRRGGRTLSSPAPAAFEAAAGPGAGAANPARSGGGPTTPLGAVRSAGDGVVASENGAGVTPMAEVPNVNGAAGMPAWTTFCRGGDPRLSKRLCDAMERLLGSPYDAWGACFAGKVFTECVKACKDIKELACGDAPDWFGACLHAYPFAECRRRCEKEPHASCPTPDEDDDGADHAKFHWLGYDREGGKLVVVEREKTILLQLYRWFGESKLSLGETARGANAKGWRRKFGQEFTEGTVAAILRRRLYLGDPEKGAEQIVPKKLWERANARLK